MKILKFTRTKRLSVLYFLACSCEDFRFIILGVSPLLNTWGVSILYIVIFRDLSNMIRSGGVTNISQTNLVVPRVARVNSSLIRSFLGESQGSMIG